MSTYSGTIQAGVMSVFEPEHWSHTLSDGSSVVVQAVPGQYPIQVEFKDNKPVPGSAQMKLVGLKMSGVGPEGGVDMSRAGQVVNLDFKFDLPELGKIVESLPGVHVQWLNAVRPVFSDNSFSLVVNDEFGKYKKAEAHAIRRKGEMNLSM